MKKETIKLSILRIIIIKVLSDLGNILICYFNIPLLYMGLKYVVKSLKHYESNKKTKFSGKEIGFKNLPYWDNKSRK